MLKLSGSELPQPGVIPMPVDLQTLLDENAAGGLGDLW